MTYKTTVEHNEIINVPESMTEARARLDFGDYVRIEQKRHGVANEIYHYKVIRKLRSNCWVEVPVQLPAKEVLHAETVDVVACICCGVNEREVLYYRVNDVRPWVDEE
jgi:hypothetical protein